MSNPRSCTNRAKRNQPFKDWWDRYAKRYPEDANKAAYLAARDAWKAATRRAKA